MIETICFTLGAIFFVLVIAIPSNPIWALVAGIFCGLTGTIIWSCSLFIRLTQKTYRRIKKSVEVPTAEDVAKTILDTEDTRADTYELHRADSYNDLTDEIIFHPAKDEPIVAPKPEPKTKIQTKPATAPKPGTDIEIKTSPAAKTKTPNQPQTETPSPKPKPKTSTPRTTKKL